jgi:hypothetical protein
MLLALNVRDSALVKHAADRIDEPRHSRQRRRHPGPQLQPILDMAFSEP